jgi:hypothetical protein
MTLLSTKISQSEYSTYGVSSNALAAYTLTATITPSNATNKTVAWSVAFSDGTSDVSGTPVTDYVTVEPYGDTLSAVVSCLSPFAKSIKITCESQSNADVKAECTVDYAKKIENMTAALTNTIIDDSGNDPYFVMTTDKVITLAESDLSDIRYVTTTDLSAISYTPTFNDVYTVDDTFSYTISYKYESKWLNCLQSGGFSISDMPTEWRSLQYAMASPKGRFYTGLYMGLNSDIGYSLISECQSNKDTLDAYKTVIANYGGDVFMYMRITASGAYSTYTQDYLIAYASGVFSNVSATGIELDSNDVVF